MLLAGEGRLAGLGTCLLCSVVSQAGVLLGNICVQLDPYDVLVCDRKHVKVYLQFRSLVFEDLEMTFHN
jgi:hypothetical protein